MRTRSIEGAGGRQGVALIYAVIGSFVVASMVAVMFTMAGASGRSAETRRGKAKARLLAEGALSAVEKDVQQALANWDDPLLSGSRPVAGQQVDYQVTELGLQSSMTDSSGIVRLVQPFELEASTREGGAFASARKIVNVEWMPLFQFAVFYGDDLEIHAGPDLTLRGRVHSNRDIFIGGGSTITLDTNYVRAVGDILRQRKHGGAAGGSVDIRQWVANPFDASEPVAFERMLSQGQLSVSSISGYDSAFTTGHDANGDGDFNDPGDLLPFEFGAAELWGTPAGYGGTEQTVMTGQHGVTEAVTPDIGSIQMYEETASGTGGDWVLNESTGAFEAASSPGAGTHERGHFHEEAGLRIIVDESGNLTVESLELGDVTALAAAAITIDSVPDMRQSDSGPEETPVIRVDVAALTAVGLAPANGLIYGGHMEMGTGTDARGLMLTNGAELPSKLTVVSSGPLYVHGDYNTVNKKGASVIGDAVNLLSNAWDGSKAPGQLPQANETTFNTAMITGSYTSEADRYNGGLENLPRFHENWSGVPCNIAGSFVNIFDSQYATGDWRYGSDRYTAPIRNWQYDDSFNDLSGLPPFTPMAVTAVPVVSW